MNRSVPSVYCGPADAQQLIAEPALLIATVHTEKTAKREIIRQQVRRAAAEILARKLNCPVEKIQLLSAPGQALRLAAPHQQIGISFSHETGCSLIAINLNGPVGIDLLQIAENPAWQSEIAQLASDYLGPTAQAQLSQRSGPEQAHQFAIAWTQHEARLKCLGLPLGEWTPQLAQDLATCRAEKLDLPANYLGAVAVFA